jgi:hypothetical protein
MVVYGAGQPEGQVSGSGPLQDEVGQYRCVYPQLGKPLAEGAAVITVVQRLGQRGADQPGRAGA